MNADEIPADLVTELRAEVAELRAIFELQWERMGAAAARWRAEDPLHRANTIPDLGALLQWLMDDADRARTGGWYLGRCGNEREPDGQVCTADLYAATRATTQVQCPGCGARSGVQAPGRLPRSTRRDLYAFLAVPIDGYDPAGPLDTGETP